MHVVPQLFHKEETVFKTAGELRLESQGTRTRHKTQGLGQAMSTSGGQRKVVPKPRHHQGTVLGVHLEDSATGSSQASVSLVR